MPEIIIRRCPVNPSVRLHAIELAGKILADLGLRTRVEDGGVNDFCVWVSKIPILQRSDKTLPSLEEVESAIRNVLQHNE